MASLDRKEWKVDRADSQIPALTGSEPYGVEGEISARRFVSRLKCFDSSRATLAQSEKKA